MSAVPPPPDPHRCPQPRSLSPYPQSIAKLSVSRTIGAPPEVVFDVFTDARRYPEYTPIRRVEIERPGEGDPNGPGAIRALHMVGPPLRERVIDRRRPERFEFEVISGSPLRSYLGVLDFRAEEAGTTVTYAIELEPLLPGTGLAAAAALRGAVEVLMRLADREAHRRMASA